MAEAGAGPEGAGGVVVEAGARERDSLCLCLCVCVAVVQFQSLTRHASCAITSLLPRQLGGRCCSARRTK